MGHGSLYKTFHAAATRTGRFRPGVWLPIMGAAVLALGIQAGSAQAALVDPSDLFIGGGSSCTSGATGMAPCGYLYGSPTTGEVGAITNGTSTTDGSFDLYLNGQPKTSLVSPVLAILAVPNTSSGAPVLDSASIGTESVTIANGSGPYSTNGSYSGALSSLTMSSSDIYTILGLAGDNSVNFANLSAADKAILGLSVAPTSFSLYVFNLSPSGTPFGGPNNDLAITFSSMPIGTFIVGYGQDVAGTAKNGNAYSTPFTESGFATSTTNNTTGTGGGSQGGTVPEPASVALLAVGLLGLVLVRARPRRQ